MSELTLKRGIYGWSYTGVAFLSECGFTDQQGALLPTGEHSNPFLKYPYNIKSCVATPKFVSIWRDFPSEVPAEAPTVLCRVFFLSVLS